MFGKSVKLSLNLSSVRGLSNVRRYSIPASTHKVDQGAKVHKFKCLYPWKTRADLAKHLHDTIVYNADGIIALNKPYGIGISPPQLKANRVIVETLSTAGQSECEFYISDVLPLLENHLGLKNLHVIKSPERYCSGVMLLSTDSSVDEKVKKSIERSKAKIFPPYVHWAVTTGIPTKSKEKSRVGLKIIDIPKLSQKAPVIVPLVTNRAKKMGLVIPATVEINTTSSNFKLNCTLVEIATTTMRHHFLRVYLAYLLAPILGDSLYSARVKMVLGKLIAVTPHNAASYSPSSLSQGMSTALQLLDSSSHVPNHLHLHRLTLTGFNKGTDVVITALPQDHFMWTLEQLNLKSETVASD